MHLIYYVKQFAGAIATPLVFCLLIAIAAMLLRTLGRQRLSGWLLISSFVLVYLSATSPVANALLVPLENRYSAIVDPGTLPPVKYVVVLGSSYAPRATIPITGALEGDSLARIVEGVRLVRHIPSAKLVVSGGAVDGHFASAEGYAEFAVEFGIQSADVIKLSSALDTAEEARDVAALVGTAPFVLVTSAYHMPRAMRLMRRAGMHPIAAPTGQLTLGKFSFDFRGWLPRTESLRKTDCAIHEYLGMALVN